MKKLIISCGSLVSGGAERVVSVLTPSFADHYESVKLCLWATKPVFYQIDRRVSVIDIEKESGSKSTLKKIIWFRHYILSESPDIILSFLYPWSMKVMTSLLFTKTTVIVAERQDPRFVRGGWLIKTLRHLLYLRAKGILVQTNENKKYYRGSLNKKTYAIYNPVGMSNEWVGKALTTAKENTIITVGRLNPAKNHILLINAFSLFVKKYPHYKLLIYGEGPLKDEIENYIRRKGLEDCVILKGAIKEVFSHMISAKVFVLSSIYEGMPNALIEAMCLGLPCVSTRVSGATELIKQGINGILIDNDEQQLAKALETLIDDSYSSRLAKNASQLYSQVELDTICNQWIDYLDTIYDGIQKN